MSTQVYVHYSIERDGYEITIVERNEHGRREVVIPLDFAWRQLTDEDAGQQLSPSLFIDKERANDFFTSMLLAARECGVMFYEPLSSELKATKDERDYLRKIIDNLLHFKER